MKWRFLNTGFNPGANNMALDEAIMQSVREGNVAPTIRFYGWEPSCISLGYFQKIRQEIDIEACKSNKVDVVRRLTGGRAILHERELTYSLMVSETYPDIAKTILSSYKWFSQGLIYGFAKLGIKVALVPPQTQREKDFASAACFDAPASYELVADGRKISGSAQVRRQGVVLQHGSIMNELDADRLFACLNITSPSILDKMKAYFISQATSIKEIRGKEATWEELCKAFFLGFSEGLAIDLVPGKLSEEEITLMEILLKKYQSEEWNLKR